MKNNQISYKFNLGTRLLLIKIFENQNDIENIYYNIRIFSDTILLLDENRCLSKIQFNKIINDYLCLNKDSS